MKTVAEWSVIIVITFVVLRAVARGLFRRTATGQAMSADYALSRAKFVVQVAVEVRSNSKEGSGQRASASLYADLANAFYVPGPHFTAQDASRALEVLALLSKLLGDEITSLGTGFERLHAVLQLASGSGGPVPTSLTQPMQRLLRTIGHTPKEAIAEYRRHFEVQPVERSSDPAKEG